MEILGISYVEWIGYLASFFLLLSFLMRNITTLRYINSLGCLLFGAYGRLLGSYPILITNAAIVLINIYYLFINQREGS